jgi:hypothetical protein
MESMQRTRRWPGQIVPVVRVILVVGFPWVGGVLLVLAAWSGGHSWWLARDQVRTTATVSENVESFARGGGLKYSPTLRFRLPHGEIVRVPSRHTSDVVDYPDGTAVPVMYPQGRPQRAVIGTLWRVYYTAFVLGIWGAVLFDLGLVARRLRRQAETSGR